MIRLLARIAEIQDMLDRLRHDLLFNLYRHAFEAGANAQLVLVQQIIAKRLDALDNWAPPLAGAIRKHELQLILEIIRKTDPDPNPDHH